MTLQGDESPEERERVALLMFAEAARLFLVRNWGGALTEYTEIVHRFGDDVDPEMRERVVIAMQGRAECLNGLGQIEDAVAVHREFVARFGDDPELREQVAKALIFAASRQLTLGRTEDSIASAEEVVKRFGDAEEESLQEWVLAALEGKGKALLDAKRHAEAIEALNALLVRAVGSEVPAILDHVAWALAHKASIFDTLGETENVAPLLEEAVERFADSGRPAQILASSTARVALEEFRSTPPRQPDSRE